MSIPALRRDYHDVPSMTVVTAPALHEIPRSRIWPLVLPLACALGLAAFALIAPVRQNPRLLSAFLGAASALVVWNAVLLVRARQYGRTFTLEIVLRKQHYL